MVNLLVQEHFVDTKARRTPERLLYRTIFLKSLGISLIAGLLVTGCTSYWRDPHQWQTRFSDDAAQCAQQASQGAGTYAPYDERHQQDFQRCMQGRGWWQAPERR